MPDEYENKHDKAGQETEQETAPPSRSGGGWIAFLIVALVAFGAMAAVFGLQEHKQVTELTAQQQQQTADISAMREQLDAATAKITDMAVAAQQAANAAAAAPAARRSTGSDKRIKQIQAKVDEQGKQIEETRQAMDQTRSDLDGRLNSTRDELGGSIARTQDELTLLKKRGENDFFEFNLTKSKGFQRAGPIGVSLRKVDVKHRRYNVNLLVDDNQLEKKNVNLFEPVWIHRNDDPQPVQLVVFQVDKNHVKGYVRAPKYRQSELAATAAPPTTPPPPEPPEW